MESLIKILVVAWFVCMLLCIGPWLFIWSVNTLIAAAMVGAPAGAFVPQIAFGFWTWLAAALLGGLGAATLSSRKSS